MKTLLITMDFPPLIGGVANYYFNRVKVMVEKSEKVAVLAPTFVIPAQAGIQARKNWIPDPPQMRGGQVGDDNKEIKIYRKNFFTKFLWPHWLPLIWQIYKMVKKEKITRLWVGQVLPVGTAVWFICWLFNHGILRSAQNDILLAYFVSCHGNDLLRAKNQPRKFKLAKRILQNAEFVEANTEFTKDILINDFKVAEEKIKIVYPINTLKKELVNEQKVEEIREKYNLKDKKVLLTVARLVESKGIDKVIEALPKVWQEIPGLVYLIIGDGPDKNRLTQIVEDFVGTGRDLSLPTQNKIIFAGAVDFKELPNYYSLANAFILTPHSIPLLNKERQSEINSDTESFGIVYLEAREFNLPIIASDAGGVKEAITDYEKSNFVNSENTADLADTIITILK